MQPAHDGNDAWWAGLSEDEREANAQRARDWWAGLSDVEREEQGHAANKRLEFLEARRNFLEAHGTQPTAPSLISGANMAFKLGMCSEAQAEYERALALQRAKDRDVEITTNAAGAACPVGELEKVLDDKYAVQLARRRLAAAEGEAPAQPTADAMEVDDDDADEEAPSQEAVLALWREAHAMAAEGAE